jgi:hypothetical protein
MVPMRSVTICCIDPGDPHTLLNDKRRQKFFVVFYLDLFVLGFGDCRCSKQDFIELGGECIVCCAKVCRVLNQKCFHVVDALNNFVACRDGVTHCLVQRVTMLESRLKESQEAAQQLLKLKGLLRGGRHCDGHFVKPLQDGAGKIPHGKGRFAQKWRFAEKRHRLLCYRAILLTPVEVSVYRKHRLAA